MRTKKPKDVVIDPGGVYKTCPVCGKVFFVQEAEKWAYYRWGYTPTRAKYKVHICSWHCLRQWDRENQPKKGRKEPTIIVRPEKYRKDGK